MSNVILLGPAGGTCLGTLALCWSCLQEKLSSQCWLFVLSALIFGLAGSNEVFVGFSFDQSIIATFWESLGTRLGLGYATAFLPLFSQIVRKLNQWRHSQSVYNGMGSEVFAILYSQRQDSYKNDAQNPRNHQNPQNLLQIKPQGVSSTPTTNMHPIFLLRVLIVLQPAAPPQSLTLAQNFAGAHAQEACLGARL